jgi:hypothetical protein
MASAPELQAVGQALELGDAEQVGDVPEPAGLLGDGGHEVRVGVAQAGHGDAGAEVEHASAVGGVKPGALPALEGQIVALVDRQQGGERLVVHRSCPLENWEAGRVPQAAWPINERASATAQALSL